MRPQWIKWITICVITGDTYLAESIKLLSLIIKIWRFQVQVQYIYVVLSATLRTSYTLLELSLHGCLLLLATSVIFCAYGMIAFDLLTV